MAITGTDRGTGGNTTNASTWAIVPTSNFDAYSTAVLCVAYDNDGGSGGDTFATITDSHANFWIPLTGKTNSPGGAANDGVVVRMFYCYQEIGTLTTGSTITLTFSGSLVAKKYTLTQFATDDADGIVVSLPRYVGATTGSGTTPSVTTTSLNSGDVVIGMFGSEINDGTITEDTDATNGSWSTAQITAAAGMSIYSQFKVLTGAGAQTYDLSGLTSGDYAGLWAVFTERTTNSIVVLPAQFNDSITSSTTLVVTTGTNTGALPSIDTGFNSSDTLSYNTGKGTFEIGSVLVMFLWHDSGVTLNSITGLGANSYYTNENTSFSGQKAIVVPITEAITNGTAITFTFSGNTIKGFTAYKVSSIRDVALSYTAGPYEYVSQNSDATFVTDSIPEDSAVLIAWQGNTYLTVVDTDTTNGFWEILLAATGRYGGSQAKVVTASGAQTHSYTTNASATSMARAAVVITEGAVTVIDPFGWFGVFGI